jgi:hypothetical protein
VHVADSGDDLGRMEAWAGDFQNNLGLSYEQGLPLLGISARFSYRRLCTAKGTCVTRRAATHPLSRLRSISVARRAGASLFQP